MKTKIHGHLLIAALCCGGCGDEGSAGGGESTGGGSTSSVQTSGSSGGDAGSGSSAGTSGETVGSGETGGGSSTGPVASTGDEGSTGVPGSDCVERAEPDCPAAPGVISTALAQSLLDEGLATALDVRGEASFMGEHLPGASVLSASDLRASVDGVSGQVAPPNVLQATFEAAGLAPDDAVVVYGQGNGTDPARVVWTLAYAGHTGPVWMLDGGIDQWSAEDRAVEAGDAPAGGSSYPPGPEEGLRVDAQWVRDHLGDPSVTLVDARSDGEFDAGHIPGALSVDWVRNLGRDGLFLPPGQLRALYGDPSEDQTLVTYCQTGSRASVDWIALRLLGYPDVRIYDGSWAQWSADPMNPVEP